MRDDDTARVDPKRLLAVVVVVGLVMSMMDTIGLTFEGVEGEQSYLHTR